MGVKKILLLLLISISFLFINSSLVLASNTFPINASGPIQGASSSGCVVPTDEMVITSDTHFCYGTYNLPHGVILKNENYQNHLMLDCYGSTLVGNNLEGFGGIILRGYNDSNPWSIGSNFIINNCSFTEYTVDIWMGAEHSVLQNDNFNDYVFISYGDNNIVKDNIFKKDLILDSSSNYNTIVNNYFLGNLNFQKSGFGMGDNFIFWPGNSISNFVYNNIFNGTTGILGWDLEENFFCVNEIGNTYLNGTTGPACPEDLEQRVSTLETWMNNTKDAICYIFNHLSIGNPFWECQGGTTTTTTTSTTTTTIAGCKLKYERCTKNEDCCNKVCNRNSGRCSL